MQSFVQKSSERASAEFYAFVGRNTANVSIKVFLCGRALRSDISVAEQSNTDLRAHLLKRLEDEVNCSVFLGEHSALIEAYHRASGHPVADKAEHSANLSLFEATLGDFVDLVVIFPDSPGSFAELGMFAVSPPMCTKLLVVIKSEYKGANSFIMRGPIIAAENNRAKIAYLDYGGWNLIYETVHAEIIRIRQTLASQEIWQRGRR